MWINANECKPDSARKVLVRMGEFVAFSNWIEAEQAWKGFFRDDKMDYWMEITDILSLPVEKKDETEELKEALYAATRLLINIKAAMFLRGIRPFANASDLSIQESIDKSLSLLGDYTLERSTDD